jgi:glycosyltransferase involved in cell wall biosynthesis
VRDLLRAYRPRLVINCVCTELARLQMAACQQMGARAIYDCMDDWSAFARMQQEVYGEDSGYAEEIERQLCQQADRVVVTASALARRLAELGCPVEKQVLAPNGLDPAFPRRRRGPRPPDLPPPPAPPKLGGIEGGRVLGYTGCLWGDWQDWDLVRTLAEARPDWAFVLLGPYAGHLDEFFADTPNVIFLGPRPHARLHEYIDYFDVALIPFKAGDFAQTISPLKVFDYLARGKPVVSPPMEALAGYPYVWTATTPEEWLTALEEALSTPPDREALAAFLAGHTWEQRLITMLGPWLEDLAEQT